MTNRDKGKEKERNDEPLDILDLPKDLQNMKGIYCLTTDQFIRQHIYKIGASFSSLYSRVSGYALYYPLQKVYILAVLIAPKPLQTKKKILGLEKYIRGKFEPFQYVYRSQTKTEWIIDKVDKDPQVFKHKIEAAFVDCWKNKTESLGKKYFHFQQPITPGDLDNKNIEKIIEQKKEKGKLKYRVFFKQEAKSMWLPDWYLSDELIHLWEVQKKHGTQEYLREKEKIKLLKCPAYREKVEIEEEHKREREREEELKQKRKEHLDKFRKNRENTIDQRINQAKKAEELRKIMELRITQAKKAEELRKNREKFGAKNFKGKRG